MGAELGCADCRMIDEFVVAEIEEEMHELYPVIIMDEMPLPVTFGWGTVNPRVAAQLSAHLLKNAEASLMLNKFSQNLKNNFVDSQNYSKTITFRRYGTDVFQDSIKSNQMTGVWYDEAEEITQETWEATGKNPHSETD